MNNKKFNKFRGGLSQSSNRIITPNGHLKTNNFPGIAKPLKSIAKAIGNNNIPDEAINHFNDYQIIN